MGGQTVAEIVAKTGIPAPAFTRTSRLRSPTAPPQTRTVQPSREASANALPDRRQFGLSAGFRSIVPHGPEPTKRHVEASAALWPAAPSRTTSRPSARTDAPAPAPRPRASHDSSSTQRNALDRHRSPSSASLSRFSSLEHPGRRPPPPPFPRPTDPCKHSQTRPPPWNQPRMRRRESAACGR